MLDDETGLIATSDYLAELQNGGEDAGVPKGNRDKPVDSDIEAEATSA